LYIVFGNQLSLLNQVEVFIIESRVENLANVDEKHDVYYLIDDYPGNSVRIYKSNPAWLNQAGED
jgi:hypothetical protein